MWSGKKLIVYAISQDKALVRVAGNYTSHVQLPMRDTALVLCILLTYQVIGTKSGALPT